MSTAKKSSAPRYIAASARAVKAATEPGYHWIESPRGLAVRVREPVEGNAVGERAFYLRVVLNGKQVIRKLAPIDAELKGVVADAQKKIALAAAGTDPFYVEPQGETVLATCLHHVAVMQSVGTRVGKRTSGKKLGEADAEKFARYFRRVLKVNGLGALTTTQLDQHNVAKWFRALSVKQGKRKGGPVAANRARALLLGALRAEGAKFDEKAFEAESTRAHTEKPRERHLTEQEASRLFAALDAAPLVWRAYFTIIATTGLRKGELRRARVEHLDGNRLTIPGENRKNGQPLTVTLDPLALQLLADLKRERPPFGGWMFPSIRKRGACVYNVNDAWEEIRTAAKLPDVTIHDLRRSFGTFAGQGGASAEQVAAALGNSSLVSARHYLKLANNRTVIEGVQQLALAKMRGVAK